MRLYLALPRLRRPRGGSGIFYKKTCMKAVVLSILSSLLFISVAAQPKSQHATVIQFKIASVLNARPVTILNNGKLITWQTGIDGGGKGDGYLTQSAAAFNKQDSTAWC